MDAGKGASRVVSLVSSERCWKIFAALCRRASRAKSVGLCPLASDGRTAIACPGNDPQAIADRFVSSLREQPLPVAAVVCRREELSSIGGHKPIPRQSIKTVTQRTRVTRMKHHAAFEMPGFAKTHAKRGQARRVRRRDLL